MKLLYCVPSVLYCGFVAAIGFDSGFGGFLPETWVYVVLLVLASVLLCMGKWWGSFPGIAVGAIIIYLFVNSRVHQHIDATPIGIAVIVYFAAMGLMCYNLQKKK